MQYSNQDLDPDTSTVDAIGAVLLILFILVGDPLIALYFGG